MLLGVGHHAHRQLRENVPRSPLQPRRPRVVDHHLAIQMNSELSDEVTQLPLEMVNKTVGISISVTYHLALTGARLKGSPQVR